MHTSSTSKPASRVWYFDLLRIIASYGIIVLHISPISPQESSIFSSEWRILMSFSILFRWSVPVFLMISGALFLSPDRELSVKQLYTKSIGRLVTSFFAWSGFYALCYCITYGKGKWTFINQLLRGHYHMWFIFTILALYMLTPLLRKLTASKEATQYFLALGFVFTFLIPRLLSFVLLFDFPHSDVVESLQSLFKQANPLSGICSIYYFVLGHYLHTYPIRDKKRRALYLTGIIGYVLAVELTIRYSRSTGASNGMFYDISSLTVLAMAAAVFLFFQSAFSGRSVHGRLKSILLHLSVCSYGVYLVHPFVIELLQLHLPAVPIVILVGTPLLVLLIYLISLLISFILNSIPVIKKYIV